MDSHSPQLPPQTLPTPTERTMEASSDISPIPPMEPNTSPDSLSIHRNVTTTEDSPWSAPAHASTQESFHLHLDSTLQPSHDSCVPSPSQEVLIMTQPEMSAAPMIVDLTHSQTPPNSCASVSESVSKGLPPRERSLAHDPVPATTPSGPKSLSLPFLRGSKSTPASPNRPLVPDHPVSASSLTKLSAPTEYDQSQSVPSPGSSFQDAQRPYSPSQEEQSMNTPPLFATPSSLETVAGVNFQPQAIHVDQSREALKRAPIPTISPQEVVDFTDSLFQEVHPTLVDQLPPPQLASLQCSFRYLDQSFSELSERLDDSQQSYSDTLKETTAAQASARRQTWSPWSEPITQTPSRSVTKYPMSK